MADPVPAGFLKKKQGVKPRPIRVGELLRRMVAKRLVHDHRGELQRFFLRRRQFGIAIPGGRRPWCTSGPTWRRTRGRATPAPWSLWTWTW